MENSISFYNRGHDLQQLKLYEESIKFYDQALQINPKNYKAHYSKGIAYYYIKQFDQAIKCYDQALKIVPQYDDAFFNKGLALSCLKQYDEAIKCYDQAIQINQNYDQAYNNKGNNLNQLQRYDEAIICLDQALKINPNNYQAYYNKGVSLQKLKKYEEAIKCNESTLKINPNYESAVISKGIILQKLNQFEEAVRCYDQGLKINPNNPSTHCYKGNALKLMKQYEEAIKCFDQAIKLNPKNQQYIDDKLIAVQEYQNFQQEKNLSTLNNSKLKNDELKQSGLIYSFQEIKGPKVILNKKKFEQEFDKLDDEILKNRQIVEGNSTQVYIVRNTGDQKYRAIRIIQVQYQESNEKFANEIQKAIEGLVQANSFEQHNNLAFIEKIYHFYEYKIDIYRDKKESILLKNPQDDLLRLGPEPSQDEIACTIIIVNPHFEKGNLHNVLNQNIFNFQDRKSFKTLALDIMRGLLFLKDNGVSYQNLRPSSIYYNGSNFKILNIGLDQFLMKIFKQKQSYNFHQLSQKQDQQEKNQIFQLGMILSKAVLKKDKFIQDFNDPDKGGKSIKEELEGVKEASIRQILLNSLNHDAEKRWDHIQFEENVNNL